MRAGSSIGEYRLTRRLGAGGFGDVWLGEHRAIPGRRAAIKIARDAAAVGRFLVDGVAQARLDAPEIVRVLGMDMDHDPPFIAYEAVLGGTLAALLPLPPARALRVLGDVAAALAHAHSRDVLHLDLKPANILMDGERARVTDFGVDGLAMRDAASLELSADLASAPVAGTLAYLAPEQRVPGPVDARADVFAFGVVLFQAVTGRLPSGLERPGEAVPGLPPAIDALYERCCAPIGRRFADGARLAEALRAAGRGLIGPIRWSERGRAAARRGEA